MQKIHHPRRHTARLALALALTFGGAVQQAYGGAFVLAYTDGQVPASYTNLQSFYSKLSAIGLGSAYNLTASGTIGTDGLNATSTSIVTFAKSKNLPIYPTVSDYSNSYGGFDPSISNTMLSTAAKRSTAVTNLVNLAVNNGFAGIDIDLEAVQPAMKANYTAFVTSLATALHNQSLKLVISIPPKNSDTDPDYLGGYDYASIGAVVDYFQLMTYDETGPGWSSSTSATWPGPEAGLDWMQSKLTYALSRVAPAKVLEGLPAYGYDFSDYSNTDTGGRLMWTQYASKIASYGASSFLDTASATPYARWGTVTQQADGAAWTASTAQPVIWYDNAASITAKAQLIGSMGLGGTSVWAMGYENAAFWDAVTAGLPNSSGDSSINAAGSGYVWTANSTALLNTHRVAAPAVNDGNTSTSLMMNVSGEGNSPMYEAAGMTFTSAKTVSSVTFINGTVDSNGNGYFQSALALQYSTDGSTWLASGWSVTPAYPNAASAAGASYQFSGAALSGVKGIRISGRTGVQSWSGAVKEVQVMGH